MTAALTQSVAGTEVFGTSPFGQTLSNTLTDPNVIAGIGNLAGSVVNSLTGNNQPTAAQLAAQAAAAKAAADAQQTQLLMIGGGVAIVAIVVVIIVVVRRKRS